MITEIASFMKFEKFQLKEQNKKENCEICGTYFLQKEQVNLGFTDKGESKLLCSSCSTGLIINGTKII